MDRLIQETSFEFVSFMNDSDIVVGNVYAFEQMYDVFTTSYTQAGEDRISRKLFSIWLNLWGFINYGRCYTHITLKRKRAFKFTLKPTNQH
jgi:hypothetical protein